MFRPMRRHKQLLLEEECRAILENATSGVLAVLGDEDYPYAVPLSFVLDGNKLYFHGAKSGHKMDALLKHPKASFCVISQDNIVPEEYTTYFRSVIAFGKVRVMEDTQEKHDAVLLLAQKYAPDTSADHKEQAIQRGMAPLCMLEMTIEHMTGKQAIGLVK